MKPHIKEFIPRAVVVKEGHALLVTHKKEGYSFMLGGRVEKNETVKACLLREIQEEIGVTATIGAFLGVLENKFETAIEPPTKPNLTQSL